MSKGIAGDAGTIVEYGDGHVRAKTPAEMVADAEPLHHLISDAHKGVLHPGDPYEPVGLIEEIVSRLETAKAAFLAGDTVAASAAFDAAYKVRDGDECDGHPAGPFDPMGETVYCDGTCK